MTTNTLQQVAAEGLQQAIELMRASGSEAVQQIPDVAQQYVRFRIADACIDTASFCLVVGVASFIWKRASKYKEEGYWDDTKTVLQAVSCAMFLISFFGLAVSITNLAKACVAPKIVILEKASELVRGPK